MLRLGLLLISLWFMPFLAHANGGGGDSGDGPAIEYLEMTPKLVINLNEYKKYMLMNIKLMVEGAEAIEKVKKNMPALRNALIMLYSDLTQADVQTMEQREALRIKSKDEIRITLDKFANSDGFRDIFFTEFFVN